MLNYIRLGHAFIWMDRWYNHTLRLATLLLLFVATVVSPLAAQTTNKPPTNPPPPQFPARLEWNAATLSLIQSNGYYGRIIRLKNGQMLCGFDFERKIWVRHSTNDGRTWEKPVEVATWEFGRLTNTELLQLGNGSLLCFYNERPRQPSARRNQTDAPQTPPEAHPYAICMVRSYDNGQTWQKPATLYCAGSEFTNGCWEPAAIELPSGEVQLFFSNEGPYRNSDEQEITLLRSTDGARTWSSPEKVSFRAGARDGMPVPLVLKDGRGIAFSIEDNGLSGYFKPVIVFSSLKDNWHSGVRGPESPNRWSALKNLPAPHVSASAPYLRQMPSGETLLSFQRSETGELKNAYMVVCIGDAEARNFDSPSRPFPVTEGKAQLWNSIFIKNKDTVVAVSEAEINGVRGIWSIEGRLVRN
jgi:BNR repeat-like domain